MGARFSARNARGGTHKCRRPTVGYLGKTPARELPPFQILAPRRIYGRAGIPAVYPTTDRAYLSFGACIRQSASCGGIPHISLLRRDKFQGMSDSRAKSLPRSMRTAPTRLCAGALKSSVIKSGRIFGPENYGKSAEYRKVLARIRRNRPPPMKISAGFCFPKRFCRRFRQTSRCGPFCRTRARTDSLCPPPRAWSRWD